MNRLLATADRPLRDSVSGHMVVRAGAQSGRLTRSVSSDPNCLTRIRTASLGPKLRHPLLTVTRELTDRARDIVLGALVTQANHDPLNP